MLNSPALERRDLRKTGGVARRKSVTFEGSRQGLQTESRSSRQARGIGWTQVRKQKWPRDLPVPEDVAGQGSFRDLQVKGETVARPQASGERPFDELVLKTGSIRRPDLVSGCRREGPPSCPVWKVHRLTPTFQRPGSARRQEPARCDRINSKLAPTRSGIIAVSRLFGTEE